MLILLATDDHKYWTTVGYGLESILPDGKVGGFGREMVPVLRSGNYAGAVTLMTARVASVIAEDAGVTLDNQPRHGQRLGGNLRRVGGDAAVVIVIVIFVVISILRAIFRGGGPRGGGGSGFWSGLLWAMLFSNMGGGRGGFGGGGLVVAGDLAAAVLVGLAVGVRAAAGRVEVGSGARRVPHRAQRDFDGARRPSLHLLAD